MMLGPKLSLVAAAGLFAALSTAMRVAPGSPCDQNCGNVLGNTAGDEMVCSESSFSSALPPVFQTCITCEQGSGYSGQGQTDVQWLLYNLRFAISYCIFGVPQNTQHHDNPCITGNACGPLQASLDWNNLSQTTGAYDYCNKWDEAQVTKCSLCLTALDDGHYINNYLTVLDAACQQKPAEGSTVSVSGTVFDKNPIHITTPTPTLASIPPPDFGPVSLGARVGIAFGAIAFILAILGFCIVMNGKRKRRAFLRELEKKHAGQGWPHPSERYGGHAQGDMFETPVSQRPLRGWDESPVSAATSTGTPLPRYFSPYSSQFNSPVSASEGGPSHANWPTLGAHKLDHVSEEHLTPHGQSPPPAFTQWPSATQEKLMQQMQMQHDQHTQRQQEIAIGLALGGDEASLRSKGSSQQLQSEPEYERSPKKGKNRDESYELQESPYSGGGSISSRTRVPTEPHAPVLHHPGYGRQYSPPSRPGTGSNVYGGLTEEDARRGHAV
ncbi:hypothetical protein GQ53DRAFT_700411 [Thozetella sp. PMI_491]|nr:hypothetical protein GQ53DRAFT_700411 [Thozetella sp. PMI_491]